MATILLSNQPLRSNSTHSAQDNNSCGIYDAKGCLTEQIQCYKPYAISNELSTHERNILASLSSPSASRDLTNLALSYGGDNALAIADISNRLNEYNIGLMGASTHVYAARMGEFGRSAKLYQEALLSYRDAMYSGTPLTKLAAQRRVETRFDQMQHHFRNEVSRINLTSNASSRGTPFTSPTRGINIARSSRHTTSLQLSSRVEADKLVHFTRYAKFLGNGLTLIDFTSRIGNVHNRYQAGENWERELFIESSSFTASALIGTGLAKAGLGILFVATPAGWVALVAGGAAVAGVAAAGALSANYYFKSNAGNWYDSILSSLGIR